MRRQNPTPSEVMRRLNGASGPKLRAWISENIPEVASRIERAKRRLAFTVHVGESPSRKRSGSTVPAAPAPRTGENVDLGSMISQLTDPKSRDVRTVAGGGGVPIESVEVESTESGLLPDHFAVKSVKEAEKALNWMNQVVATNRKTLDAPYYKTVVRVRWRDGADWQGRFDLDGVWQTRDLFGRGETGGGITWNNTTDKNKVYDRTGDTKGATFKVPQGVLQAYKLAPAKPIKAVSSDAYGGSTVAPGTWLFMQLPGGSGSEAVQLVSHSPGTGFGGYWTAARHGGVTPYRIEDSRIRDLTHGEPLRRGNYSKQLGFLAAVIPDARYRKVFIERSQQIPIEAAAEKAEKEARQAEALRKHGPWFAEVLAAAGKEAGHTGSSRSLGDAAIGRFLKSFLHQKGIEVKTGVRRYSMASGMDFEYKKADKEKLETLFPGITAYTDAIYPTAAHGDRSDSQTDYHNPGGFRVSPSADAAVQKALVTAIKAEDVREAEKKKAKKEDAPKVWASQWKAGDYLIQPGNTTNSIYVYEITGPGQRKSGTPLVASPQMVEVARSSVWQGKRAFYNTRASKGAGKGVGHDETPDFTFKKLLAKGGSILRKYMPEVKGHRVLVRGAGWYADGPSGKYENYAYDVG